MRDDVRGDGAVEGVTLLCVGAVEGLGDADGESGSRVEGDVTEGGSWWRRWRRWRFLRTRRRGVGYLRGGIVKRCGLADDGRRLRFDGAGLLRLGRCGRWRRRQRRRGGWGGGGRGDGRRGGLETPVVLHRLLAPEP